MVKEIAGEDVSEADYAQRMVGLISQRRKLIAKQKAKAQRYKPMTQAQQRQYMATYLKNQGGWKLAQIKKLTDEELKEKFKYLMRSMEREDIYVPKEKDKESVKREEEFEIKKPVLRYTKRKSLARKGLQKKPESAKSGTEEDVEAYMEERVDEPSSEEFPMSSIPQGPAPAKIVKWQIIKTGKRGAYQIIREDNTDVVYVNFPGLLNDLTRDDLKELYRLMMLKYGDNRPEEEYERVLWGDLKTMFDPPSTEDAVWSLAHQQKLSFTGEDLKLKGSSFQGKIVSFREIHDLNFRGSSCKNLFVLSSSNRGRLLGFTDLMRQKNKRMKQEGLIQHYGILEDLKSNSSYLLI
ncbi:hypothetical protein Tco_1394820 [Tanacetum coccineum]